MRIDALEQFAQTRADVARRTGDEDVLHPVLSAAVYLHLHDSIGVNDAPRVYLIPRSTAIFS